MVTRLRNKGQVTIPAHIREALNLTSDSLLSVTKVGDAILLTPQPSMLKSVSKKFTQSAKAKKITLENLLQDLKELRQ